MGTLSYTATISLDGFVADTTGNFDFAAPSAEIFDVHVERSAAISTEILGRRTYELMTYWEAEPEGENWGAAETEFARRWRELDRFVASATLRSGDLGLGATLVPELDLADVQRIVDAASGEVEIFGPTIAAPAIRAGLVSELRLFLVPRILGGGLRALPVGAELTWDLAAERRFENGTVLLHYRRG